MKPSSRHRRLPCSVRDTSRTQSLSRYRIGLDVSRHILLLSERTEGIFFLDIPSHRTHRTPVRNAKSAWRLVPPLERPSVAPIAPYARRGTVLSVTTMACGWLVRNLDSRTYRAFRHYHLGQVASARSSFVHLAILGEHKSGTSRLNSIQ